MTFTSGGTESNNLAIKGGGRFHKDRRPKLVTMTGEHKCVLESAKRMAEEGMEVVFLDPKPDGLVDLDELTEAVDEATALVSIMAVNNEIGVIQPLEAIGKITRAAGALFHCDAAQAVGKIDIDVNKAQIDLLSISGHKLYGPKGIGALYVRRRPRARIEPLFDGGGQERALRSGTLPAPLCVGLGEAAAIAGEEMERDHIRLTALRERYLAGIRQKLEGVFVNGDLSARYPGNLNLRFAGVRGDQLIKAVPKLALSTGSACSSASVEPSYVLRALGMSDEAASECLRIGFGRPTSEADVDRAVDLMAEAVTRLRAESASKTA